MLYRNYIRWNQVSKYGPAPYTVFQQLWMVPMNSEIGGTYCRLSDSTTDQCSYCVGASRAWAISLKTRRMQDMCSRPRAGWLWVFSGRVLTMSMHRQAWFSLPAWENYFHSFIEDTRYWLCHFRNYPNSSLISPSLVPSALVINEIGVPVVEEMRAHRSPDGFPFLFSRIALTLHSTIARVFELKNALLTYVRGRL